MKGLHGTVSAIMKTRLSEQIYCDIYTEDCKVCRYWGSWKHTQNGFPCTLR